MAKSNRRRRRRSPAPARKQYRRRGRSSGGGVGGFVNKDLLMSGAGIAAGFIGIPLVISHLPASIQQSMAGSKYTGPALKAGVGILAAYFLKRVNRPLALSLAGGAIASAMVDLYNTTQLPGSAGASLGVPGYDANGNPISTNPAMAGIGWYQLDDGSYMMGYQTPDGRVMTSQGQLAGYAIGSG